MQCSAHAEGGCKLEVGHLVWTSVVKHRKLCRCTDNIHQVFCPGRLPVAIINFELIITRAIVFTSLHILNERKFVYLSNQYIEKRPRHYMSSYIHQRRCTTCFFQISITLFSLSPRHAHPPSPSPNPQRHKHTPHTVINISAF